MEQILDVRGVWKSFDANGEKDVRDAAVVKDVSFKVRTGEIFAIVGPSGAGKSTLLRMINVLEEPTEGSVFFSEKDMREWDVPELRRKVAILYQTPTMFPGTVHENLLVPCRFKDGRRACGDEAWFKELLAGVGLDESFLSREASTLSVGQQQRVAFARALSLKPEMILLDEPTASLDPSAAVTFLRNLSSFSRDHGLTVVMVAHQLAHIREIADRVMLMVDGKEVCLQPTDEFFRSPENSIASNFISGALETSV